MKRRRDDQEEHPAALGITWKAVEAVTERQPDCHIMKGGRENVSRIATTFWSELKEPAGITPGGFYPF